MSVECGGLLLPFVDLRLESRQRKAQSRLDRGLVCDP